MPTTQQVLLFGDANVDKLLAIKELFSLSQTRPQLRDFLRAACDAIQCHLSTLVPEERAVFGHFDDLLELAERYESQQNPDEMLGYVILTTIQIGDLLRVAEQDPSLLSKETGSVLPLGFCIGLLAAAVAVASRNTSEVVRLGCELVGVSFRLGVAIRRRSKCIEDSVESWGCTLFEMELEALQKRLTEFNHAFPMPRWAYVGVGARQWMTVFAPPSTLRQLRLSIDVPQKVLTAAAAVHAPHLPPLDINAIVGDSPILNAVLPTTSYLISTSSSSQYKAHTLRDLLQSIVEDVAHKPLWMDNTAQSLATAINSSSEIKLTTLGPCRHTLTVQKILMLRASAVQLSNYEKALPVPENLRGGSGDIAIIGMSGRFPESEDVNEFWETLQSGNALHQKIPPSRFNIDDFYDHSGETKNSIQTKFGVFLKNPGLFDNKLFNVSPKEALQMDPLQRMLLMCTYEALEQAGYARDTTNSSHPSRIGTYFGQTVDDWKDVNAQQGIDTHYLPSLDRAFHPGRVAHYFKWGGGFYSVDTACSSSLTCAHLACDALIKREHDMTIVAGGSLLGSPEMFSGLSKGGFLSPTGGCKTFQDDADGYCRGEAVGVVILKRLEDAIRENDNILAVIKSTARNSNAGGASITYPGQDAQESLFRRLLRQACIDPHEVGFVEMHGTGTQAGDNVEINTVRNVFAQNRATDNPLYIGAVKANVGHSEAAAGIVSLVKSLLILREGRLSPQPGYPFKLNHRFPNLHESNIIIADGMHQLLPPPSSDGKRRIVVNSFDAAGGNTSILIEDAPRRQPQGTDPRTCHVITISSRSLTSQRANKERLRHYLQANPNVSLGDLSYTTTARRQHELYREAYVSESVEELLKQLHPSNEPKLPPKSTKPSLLFMFTGQSSQYTGMGKTLYETSPRFKQTLDSYQAICDHQELACFIDIICGKQDVETATAAQLQLAIVALEIALSSYWQSLGLHPSLVVGHSLGEYAALCVAGVLSISDTLFLVNKRATLMEKYCGRDSSAMLAIALPRNDTMESLKGRPSCEISCLNGPSSTVVSGQMHAIESLKAELKEKKIESIILATQFGFHSQAMDPILDEFEAASTRVNFAPPKIAVASTLTGEIVESEGIFNATYLRRQIREPVAFTSAVESCISKGLLGSSDIVFEIGPHPVCVGFVAQIASDAQPTCLASLHRRRDNWKTISEALAIAHVAKLPVLWHEFHSDHLNCLRLLDLPTYAFDLKEYWAPYQTSLEAAPQVHADPPFSSTCLQRVESLRCEDGDASVVFLSQVSEPNLYKAIRGHVVDEVAICPASVFSDMAFTAATFILKQAGIQADVASLELVDLNMTHALVVHSRETEQVVQISASLDSIEKYVSISFSSAGSSTNMAEHGTCGISFKDGRAAQEAEWSRMQHLVKARVDDLARSKSAHHMTRPLIYKLFSTLVDYEPSYHALSEIHIEENFQDVAATIALTQDEGLGSFTHSPYTVDALVHLAGFLLNTDPSKSKSELYIAGNIGRMCILDDFSKHQQCTAYATIRERTSKGACLCDVYVFEDSKLVALCTDIRFQKLSREIFSLMLAQNNSSSNDYTPRNSRSPSMESSTFSSEVLSQQSAVSTPVSGSSSHTSVETFDLSSILLDAVAANTGVSLLEIQGDSNFAELGIDSQMSISIIANFKKRTGVELPAAFFSNFPTVSKVEEELENFTGGALALPSKPQRGSQQHQNSIPRRRAVPSPPKSNQSSTDTSGHSEALLKIVGNELGLDVSELTPSTEFATIGVDSMLSIKIISNFKKHFGVELPAAFFNTNPTVAQVRDELDRPAAAAQPKKEPVSTLPRHATHIESLKRPESRVILIQGKSQSTETPLFLATDGSGAVTPYIHLPALPNGRKIYALESPFLEHPDEYTLKIEEMADVFIAAIRRIQPHGPYLIGGWSAGGVYAYEIAYRLAMQGERITGLIIIDTRVNHSVPEADVTMEFIERFGIFTGVSRGNLLSGLSEKQKRHLTSTVRALCKYDPTPFPEGRAPRRTHIIWAAKGLNDSPNTEEHDDRITWPAAMKPGSIGKPMSEMTLEDFELEFKSWFFAKRQDFGTNGWEDLLGNNIVVHKVDADHFSMVVPPRVQQLGSVLLESIDDFALIEVEY